MIPYTLKLAKASQFQGILGFLYVCIPGLKNGLGTHGVGTYGLGKAGHPRA